MGGSSFFVLQKVISKAWFTWTFSLDSPTLIPPLLHPFSCWGTVSLPDSSDRQTLKIKTCLQKLNKELLSPNPPSDVRRDLTENLLRRAEELESRLSPVGWAEELESRLSPVGWVAEFDSVQPILDAQQRNQTSQIQIK